jgi:predicted AAA+ superfamily ATPase
MVKSLEIQRKDVLRRLAEDNPWWVAGGSIDPEWRTWKRRAYFAPFMRLATDLDVSRAVVLIGPRRVGKTVMVKHAVQSLLDQGTPGIDILYLSLETPLYSGRSLESLLRDFMEVHDHPRDRRLWVFFDEVQYLRDWEVHLKSLVDSYRNVRFVVSGSAAAALKMKSRESGAGRFTDFMLPPLTFAEYLDFAGVEESLIGADDGEPGKPPVYRARDIVELNREFVNYLNYGGFPEAVMNPAVRGNPSRYLRQDIVDKVLLKDLPSLFGIQDTQELNRFFNVLAYNTGEEVSPETLSKHSGIGKQKLTEYLEYLEAAFLIRRVHRLDANAKRLKRARTFKVYLTNPSIRAALFGNVRADDSAIGQLAETALWSQWLHRTTMVHSLHYARWKQGSTDLEVDLVSLDPRTQAPRFAVEIKWSDAAYDNWRELRGLREFASRHRLERNPLVTTLTKTGRGEDGAFRVDFTPTSLHCYTIARNLLRAGI